MGQLDQPGYPLPEGELGDDEIVCQLVFLPDRDEYWQAFLGAYSYMTTWRAWERDDDKRGKDAAANWRAAFELTIGCWRMACLEQLQQDVSDILALLRNQDACCGDIITYYDNSTYITIIVPGDGDPPATYGETAVEDWEEWSEYLCHNANLWVDELVRAAQTIATALSTGGITIGLLAAVIAAITFFVVGGVLALPLLMVVVFGLTVEVSSTVFTTAATDIEDARDEIICALLSGRSVEAAVETALSSGAAWDLLYTHIDYDSATAILYEGGDGEDTWLEAEKDDSCTCLCAHVVNITPENNTILYQSASGCQVEMEIHEALGYDTVIYCQLRFNSVIGGTWCGPEKIIDTISVNDALDFSYIEKTSDTGNDSWGVTPFPCVIDLTVLEDEQAAIIKITRTTVPYGGCAVGTIIVTMTYHDAAE